MSVIKVIVDNIPSGCGKCQFFDDSVYVSEKCRALNQKVSVRLLQEERALNCPLRTPRLPIGGQHYVVECERCKKIHGLIVYIPTKSADDIKTDLRKERGSWGIVNENDVTILFCNVCETHIFSVPLYRKLKKEDFDELN